MSASERLRVCLFVVIFATVGCQSGLASTSDSQFLYVYLASGFERQGAGESPRIYSESVLSALSRLGVDPTLIRSLCHT